VCLKLDTRSLRSGLAVEALFGCDEACRGGSTRETTAPARTGFRYGAIDEAPAYKTFSARGASPSLAQPQFFIAAMPVHVLRLSIQCVMSTQVLVVERVEYISEFRPGVDKTLV